MRITGGILGGRHVNVPGGAIRPAMDRMRESFFAVLGDLTGSSFLDVFSGSGIVALEAASRGAEYIEAVEMDPLKRKTLLENVKISPVRIHCKFISAELYVKRASRSFDFIFLDPPFPYRHKKDLLISVAKSPLMSGTSLLLLHLPGEELEDCQPPQLVLKDTREYGRSLLNFYRLPDN